MIFTVVKFAELYMVAGNIFPRKLFPTNTSLVFAFVKLHEVIINVVPRCFRGYVDMISSGACWIAFQGAHADVQIAFAVQRNHNI